MRKLALFTIILLVLGSTSVLSAPFTFTEEGISFRDSLLYAGGNTTYPVIMKQSPGSLRRKHKTKTTCLYDNGRPFDCNMLFMVGYADKATITINNGAVQTITILELLQ